MEEVFYFNELYDLYGNLLTEKQKNYFEDYYFQNLSLGEMAENYEVSRNAIFKQVHVVTRKLQEVEERLGFYKKIKELKSMAEEISDISIKEKIEQLF